MDQSARSAGERGAPPGQDPLVADLQVCPTGLSGGPGLSWTCSLAPRESAYGARSDSEPHRVVTECGTTFGQEAKPMVEDIQKPR